MTRGRLLPTLTACAMHGAVAVLPVEFDDGQVADTQPVVTLRLAPTREPALPPVSEPSPPPTSPPLPSSPPVVERPARRPPRPKPLRAKKVVRRSRRRPPEPVSQQSERRSAEATPQPSDPMDVAPPRVVPPSVSVAAKPASPAPAARIDLRAYGRGVYRSVVGYRRYPRVARRLGLEGRVLVKISVAHDGRLAGEPVVYRSSGHELLDREALRMVRQASPFAPLPEGFSKPVAVIVVPIEFRLES